MCKLKRKDSENRKRSEPIKCRQNPKLFLQMIKSNSNKKSKIGDTINSNDWFKYFKALFSPPETQAGVIHEDIFQNKNANDLELPISELKIKNSIKALK